MATNGSLWYPVARALIPLSMAGASLLALAAPNVGELSSTSAIGPDVDVNRWTIDGGGVMLSTGGDFELSGTIGQPDAGTLLGGDYELNGGFWFPIAVGDCNVDGIVDLHDYADFLDCATGPDSGPVAPTCTCPDYDQDGDVDLRDWGVFQAGFGR